MARIRWIAFDAVGTLIHPQPAAAEAYFAVARRHGSRLTLPEIASRFSAAFDDSERCDFTLGSAATHWGTHVALPVGSRLNELVTNEEHERERWRYIVGNVIDDVADGDDCFEELFAHFAEPASWRCFDDTGPALARLQAQGCRLAIASNFDARLHAVCDSLPELRPIERRIISSEVGHRKPSLLFYESLLTATGCRPSELLMVGDDEENDIDGARRAGIPSVFLNRRGPLRPGEISTLDQLVVDATE